MKGVISVKIVAILIVIVIALAGLLYAYINSLYQQPKDLSRYCEALCVKNDMRFGSYNQIRQNCHCYECDEQILLDKNITFCTEKVYNIAVSD